MGNSGTPYASSSGDSPSTRPALWSPTWTSPPASECGAAVASAANGAAEGRPPASGTSLRPWALRPHRRPPAPPLAGGDLRARRLGGRRRSPDRGHRPRRQRGCRRPGAGRGSGSAGRARRPSGGRLASRLHPFGLPFAPPPTFPVEDLTPRAAPAARLALATPVDGARSSWSWTAWPGRSPTCWPGPTRWRRLGPAGPDPDLPAVGHGRTPGSRGWCSPPGQRSVVLVRGLASVPSRSAASNGSAVRARRCPPGVDVAGLPRLC